MNTQRVPPMRTYVSELLPVSVEAAATMLQQTIRSMDAGTVPDVRASTLWRAHLVLIAHDDPDMQRIGYSLALRALGIEPSVVNDAVLADIYDQEDGYGLSRALDDEARQIEARRFFASMHP